ncbi:MAG: effector binding domain-containing protein [Tenericutes bacterium]|jgi:predicted transcriptional regulator YdeE|nr:effector binding domain-containing protein [Mycoplasmatota bacterium]
MKYIVKDFDTRYFAGIELLGGFKINSDDQKKIPGLWEEFENVYLDDIPQKIEPMRYIGLEIYRFDFMETKTVDYYAMVETDGLIEVEENLVTKKLPKGKYVMFPIKKADIKNEIKKVYRYVENEDMNVHLGFHVEDYHNEEESHFNNEMLYLSFKLED